MNQAMAQMMGGEYVCEDEWGEEYPSSLPCDEEACVAACSICGEQFDCEDSHSCDWITCSICYTQYIRGQGHSCTVVGDNNENENGNTGGGSGGSGGSSGTGGGSNTGGNSSNGGESTNTSPPTITGGTAEQRATIQSVVNELISVYNLNMNGINIRIMDTNCSSSAKILSGYTGIGICLKYFTYEYSDRIAILWHEVYHYQNDDKSWENSDYYRIDNYVATPPENINSAINYLVEHYDGISKDLYGTSSWDYAYNDWITLSNFVNPAYTQNEINAYEAEISNVPNVSEYYQNERIVLLWQHQERLKQYK